MCTEILVNGQPAATIGEAKKLGLAVVFGPGYEELKDEYCLCGLDARASAKASRMKLRESRITDDLPWGGYVFTHKESKP